MDGVTILTEYWQRYMSGSTCLWLCVLAGIILALSIIIFNGFYDNVFIGIFSIACAFVGAIMFLVCVTLFLSPQHIEYKITVDDTVTVAELTEHYQITSQDGKLFTVKDLEETE